MIRNRLFQSFSVLAVFVLLTQCAYREPLAKKPVNNPMSMSVDSLIFEAHLDTLSSDYFMGRMPFTKGGERTINYLVETFKRYGMSPMGDSNYLQAVPMVEIDGTPGDFLDIDVNGAGMKLRLSEDYIIHSERPTDRLELEDAQLVYCGYGIVAPEYDWNDYKGVDMKGKIAVVLVNDPGLGGEDPKFFKGDVMTYYGRWTYKYEEADRQGAAGLLLIHETNMASYPWQVVRSSWAGPQLHLDRGADAKDCGIKGWIHLEKAKELMSKMNMDLSTMIKQARKPGFKPVKLPAYASMTLENVMDYNTSSNVLAVKKGTTFPDEYIVVTAHWDHLGIGRPVDGDSIYNGALDNASGTALTLSLAQAIQNQSWQRSIIFAMVTAEEQGLIGSRWMVEHPTYNLQKTVANINIDGVNIYGKARDLTITGYNQSTMDELAALYAKKQGRYVQGEADPTKGSFFRSDHFSFAKAGIPALYAKGGNDHFTKGVEYAKEQKKLYTQSNYHQPSDEYISGQWDLTGALQDGELFLDILERLANQREVPHWKAQSEFKSADRRQFEKK